jgi:hypothetical protein
MLTPLSGLRLHLSWAPAAYTTGSTTDRLSIIDYIKLTILFLTTADFIPPTTAAGSSASSSIESFNESPILFQRSALLHRFRG